MRIDREDYAVTPEFWEAFAGWWGDKAYREADTAEWLEAKARNLAADELQEEVDDFGYDNYYPYHPDYSVGYYAGIEFAIERIRQAPKTGRNMAWLYGEIVTREEYDAEHE